VVQIQFLIVMLLGLVMAKYTTKDIEALAKAMRFERDQGRPFSFLTGAGCSVTAKIPAIPGLLKIVNDHAHGERVRENLKCASLENQDYGAVMGSLTIDERKDILNPLLKDAKVNWGHIALASLMKAGYIGRVLTFNFDSVLARAAGVSGLYPATYDFGVSPADTFDHIVTPSILHLHGQGHGLAMMNSAEETEAHARKLVPLFKDTFEKSNVLVIGYSGKGDKAFSHLKDTYANRKRLYWCNFEERAPESHVAEILAKGSSTAKYFEGADFDNFMIDLATELKAFPPLLFSDTAQHVLDDIAPIVAPPEDVRGAEGLLDELKLDLKDWQKTLKDKISIKIRNAMLKKDWTAAIALEGKAVSTDDREEIAWAYTMQGNELSDFAQIKNDETLFHQSFAKYEAALKIKPDKHEALHNWGAALSDLAKLKNDEALFHQSIAKFEAALKIKPDDHETLNNWGNALSDLARLQNDEALFHESFVKFEAALKIKPDLNAALYNWGNALSDLAKLKNDEALFRESFAKYEAALKIKPDLHEALYNWGNALLDLARLKNDETSFHQSFAKYEAALKFKPDDHEALNNWGVALLGLARLKNDETSFHQSFAKYEAALKIKPDKHEALNNWSSAISGLYHLSGDRLLLPRIESLAAQAEKISGRPDYNLACVYALQDKEDACRAQLFKCKNAGTLPDAAHLAVDEDMKSCWEKDWFKALVAG
jgi:tetratricopeptide (TPR) repeat protein